MLKKIILYALFFCLLIVSVISLTPMVRNLVLSTGIVPEEVMIAGTGSMYPTFPKGTGRTDLVRASEIVAWPKMRKYPTGIKIFGLNLFTYNLQHGDIVEIENGETKTLSQEKYGDVAGFVKRIVALPGDTIELRDGYVLLNGNRISEPYTAKPRSTYGGTFLSDCQRLQIPEGKAFVMGDNRKASLDSRFELGLISLSDIHFVLPISEQNDYKKLWRDTGNDSSLANTPTLESATFVSLLNGKRSENNFKPYNLNVLLSSSARIRGEAMISSNDFSTEATRSGMTLESSVSRAGYKNILYAEFFTRGYYEADELLDNFLEFPDTKKILYSKEYQDIGLSAVIGSIDGCPVQVVVAHLGGYVPPNYTKEEKDSWQKLIDNLSGVLPSWESLKNANGVNQDKLNSFLNILHTRLSRAQEIENQMKSNLWLTDSQKQYVTDDKNLAAQAETLMTQLQSR